MTSSSCSSNHSFDSHDVQRRTEDTVNRPRLLDRPLEYDNVRTTTEAFAPKEISNENLHEDDMSSLSFHPGDVDEAILINVSDAFGSDGVLRVEEAPSGANSPARSTSRSQQQLQQCNDLPELVEELVERVRFLTSDAFYQDRDEVSELISEHAVIDLDSHGCKSKEESCISRSSKTNDKSETKKRKTISWKSWICFVFGSALLFGSLGFYCVRFPRFNSKGLTVSSSEEDRPDLGEIQECPGDHSGDDDDFDSSNDGTETIIRPEELNLHLPFLVRNVSFCECGQECLPQEPNIMPLWETTLFRQPVPSSKDDGALAVVSHPSNRGEAAWQGLTFALFGHYLLILSASLLAFGVAGLFWLVTIQSKMNPTFGANSSLLPQPTLVKTGSQAVENTGCPCAQHTECKCPCCKTLTKFDNLIEFHKTFEPSRMGRKKILSSHIMKSTHEFPDKYNKLTMTELKNLLVSLDPTLAGPKDLHSSSKPLLVARVYHSYAHVLTSFTRLQLLELLDAKGACVKKRASKKDLVNAALEVGF